MALRADALVRVDVATIGSDSAGTASVGSAGADPAFEGPTIEMGSVTGVVGGMKRKWGKESEVSG